MRPYTNIYFSALYSWAKSRNPIGLILAFFISISLWIPQSGSAASLELTNLVVKKKDTDLMFDLEVKNIFDAQTREALANGIPIRLSFVIILRASRDFWFDKKIKHTLTAHAIHYELVKRTYHVTRTWERDRQWASLEFQEAAEIFSSIVGRSIIGVADLEQGKRYNLKIKSALWKGTAGFEMQKQETDWLVLSFVF